jgi:hypothetical protein
LSPVRNYARAGYDEVFVQQMGPDQEGFLKLWFDEAAPRL